MKKLALSLLFLFQAILVMAQNHSTVKGKIVDSKTQNPLGGVKVICSSMAGSASLISKSNGVLIDPLNINEISNK